MFWYQLKVTGGHVIPVLNINDHLSNKFNIYIVKIWENEFIDKNKYKFDVIETPKLPSSIIKYPIIFFTYILTYKILYLPKKKKINYLISTGGYMSMPFCIIAKFLSINIYLFEPNKVLGRSNKLILGSQKKLYVTMKISLIFHLNLIINFSC